VAPARLGKELPEKVLRFRGLPIATKQDFIDMCTAEKLFWEETEISPLITLTSDQLNELMEYQLHQSSWSLLPQTHRGARYSGPLLEVLRLRGVEKGNRLSTLTKDQYRDGLWGYVREVAPDWSWLKTHDGQELKDFLPRSVYKKATDWVLEDNYSTKVAVISEPFGYAQSVSKLLKTAGLKPVDAEPDDNAQANAEPNSHYAGQKIHGRCRRHHEVNRSKVFAGGFELGNTNRKNFSHC
jgi:hypothetical protein